MPKINHPAFEGVKERRIIHNEVRTLGASHVARGKAQAGIHLIDPRTPCIDDHIRRNDARLPRDLIGQAEATRLIARFCAYIS